MAAAAAAPAPAAPAAPPPAADGGRARRRGLGDLDHLSLERSFSFLGARDLCSCARVSERWNRVGGRSQLWWRLCELRGWHWQEHTRSYHRHRHLTAKQFYRLKHEVAGRWVSPRALSSDASFELVDATLGAEGRRAMAGLTGLFVPHSSAVYRWGAGATSSFNTDMLVSCSGAPQNKFRVWDVRERRVLRSEPTEHQTCIDISDDYVVTGEAAPRSGVLARVFDLRKGQQAHILRGHTSTICAMRILTATMGAPILVTGGYDRVVCVWNLETGSLMRSLVAHEGTVWCVDAFDMVAQDESHRSMLEASGLTPADRTDADDLNERKQKRNRRRRRRGRSRRASATGTSSSSASGGAAAAAGGRGDGDDVSEFDFWSGSGSESDDDEGDSSEEEEDPTAPEVVAANRAILGIEEPVATAPVPGDAAAADEVAAGGADAGGGGGAEGGRGAAAVAAGAAATTAAAAAAASAARVGGAGEAKADDTAAAPGKDSAETAKMRATVNDPTLRAPGFGQDVATADSTADGTGASVRDRMSRAAKIQLRRILIASGSNDNRVIIWDAADTAAPKMVMEGHTSSVMAIKVDHVSQRVVSTGYDTDVRVWDLSTGKTVHVMKRHTAPVFSLAVDWGNGLAASGSRDGTAVLWDIVAGAPLRTLGGHSVDIKCLFLKDCRLISGSVDGVVNVHDVSPDAFGAGEGDYDEDDRGCAIM